VTCPVSRLVTVGDRSVAAAGPRLVEHSAWGHYICAAFAGVPTKTEDSIFVSTILSGQYTVACVAIAPGGP